MGSCTEIGPRTQILRYLMSSGVLGPICSRAVVVNVFQIAPGTASIAIASVLVLSAIASAMPSWHMNALNDCDNSRIELQRRSNKRTHDLVTNSQERGVTSESVPRSNSSTGYQCRVQLVRTKSRERRDTSRR